MLRASRAFALGVLALMALDAGPLHAEGDAAAGRKKAFACQSCHGANGLSTVPEAPNLAGGPALYFSKSLNDYRQGLRKNDAMTMIAQRLKDQDIADLAAYYAAMKVSVTVP